MAENTPEQKKETEAKKKDECPVVVPAEVQEFIGDAPPEVKKEVMKAFQMMSVVRMQGMPASNPILEKVNSTHIDKVLDGFAKDDEREHDKFKLSYIWGSIYILLFLAFSVFCIVFFVQNGKDNLLNDLIKFGLGVVGGFGIKEVLTGIFKRNP